MNAGFWLRRWRNIFPKPKARVIESAALIKAMREIAKREARNVPAK